MDEFPVDSMALNAVELSLGYYLEADPDGDPEFPFKGAGAPFSLTQLLDFYSGHSDDDNVLEGYVGEVPLYVNEKPHYTERDVIQALIHEVRRLRNGED